jgi:hypothetical protein
MGALTGEGKNRDVFVVLFPLGTVRRRSRQGQLMIEVPQLMWLKYIDLIQEREDLL